MKTKFLLLLSAVTIAAFFAGCATPGPFAPQDTTKYGVENTEVFVLMDKPTQNSVTCTGIKEEKRADGSIAAVVANVKNRENRRIEVQISCLFKDSAGFSTGDETPYQTLILGENATQPIRFASINSMAHKYTIRVRQAR